MCYFAFLKDLKVIILSFYSSRVSLAFYTKPLRLPAVNVQKADDK